MKKRIFCVDINHGAEEFYLEEILNRGEKRIGGYVCFTNVHMLIEAYDDPAFATIVNEAAYALPDGFPIAKSLKHIHGINQKRITGMDMFPSLIDGCNKRKLKVAFIGSTNEVLSRLIEKIKLDYNNITITATISPPFGKAWNNSEYLTQIESTGTNIVFVALGCPKQEKWMHENFKLTNALMLGIGGALPTYAGEIPRAPKIMREVGLEWLFRFYKEPRRMFSRYFYTNSKFLWLFVFKKGKSFKF